MKKKRNITSFKFQNELDDRSKQSGSIITKDNSARTDVSKIESSQVANENGEHTQVKNENLVSIDQLGVQINEFHVKAKTSEKDAFLNAWEAGVRLNIAFNQVKYGDFGKYLQDNCPDLGLTTVWRYRKLADSYSSVEELAGMTLSEAYAKLGLATFQDEAVTTSESVVEKKGKPSNSTPNPQPKLLRNITKAYYKFDEPTSLSPHEKTAVKQLGSKLEDVYGRLNKPSILGIQWQDRLANPVKDWEPEERSLFEEDYAQLEDIHNQVLALTEGE